MQTHSAAVAPLLFAIAALLPDSALHAEGWPVYGGDPGGTRYSSAAQIDRTNVSALAVAWTYRTGEAARRGAAFSKGAFEGTPILADGKLLLCTPFNRLIALDPSTGHELWTFDPDISTQMQPGQGLFICRGVAVWHDRKAAAGTACATKVFMATNDARLFAIDAASGQPCSSFGKDGVVAPMPAVPLLFKGEHQITSAPTVVGDVVIIGSAAPDNFRRRSADGPVTAFNARSGAVVWSFDPIPRSADDPAAVTWEGGSWAESGGGEMWSTPSVDEARDLLFLPMSGSTPTYFGGERPGANLYTDCIVALRASTGELVWSFQIVHHDIWDYDLTAQPTLVTLYIGGRETAALVEATKTGFVFVLDRETGKPIFPVEERPVPASDVAGEAGSPIEPIPVTPPPLVPQSLTADDAYGIAWFDRRACAQKIAALRNAGLFTPPSLKGSLEFPFAGGGVNWGSTAIDPSHGLLIVNTNRLAHAIRLIPRADFAKEKAAHPDREISPQLGTPYGVERVLVTSPLGLPCNPPPWGMLTAVDLDTGTIKWNAVLGTVPETVPIPLPFKFGVPNFGGPIVTAGGLIFIAAAIDDYIRAFDVDTGAELWKHRLPVGGQATPMTYTAGGKQFVVIAAGGYPRAGVKLGDYVIAFALPDPPR
jgi:quinoprotein glucose dehydrogenase